MLYVTGEHVASGSKLSSCLNLVDLAGSERVGRSGAEGARLKEGVRHQQVALLPRGRVPGAVAQAGARAVPQLQAHVPAAAVPGRRRQDAHVRQHQPRGAQRRGVGARSSLPRRSTPWSSAASAAAARSGTSSAAHAGEDGPHQGKRKAGGDEGRQGGQGAARLRRTRGRAAQGQARARAEGGGGCQKVQDPARAP